MFDKLKDAKFPIHHYVDRDNYIVLRDATGEFLGAVPNTFTNRLVILHIEWSSNFQDRLRKFRESLEARLEDNGEDEE